MADFILLYRIRAVYCSKRFSFECYTFLVIANRRSLRFVFPHRIKMGHMYQWRFETSELKNTRARLLLIFNIPGPNKTTIVCVCLLNVFNCSSKPPSALSFFRSAARVSLIRCLMLMYSFTIDSLESSFAQEQTDYSKIKY